MKHNYPIPHIEKSNNNFSVRISTYDNAKERDGHLKYFETGADFKVGFDIKVLWRTVYVMLSLWKEGSR